MRKILEIIPKISDLNLKYDLHYYLDIFDNSYYFKSPETKIEILAIDSLYNFFSINNISELKQILKFKFINFNSNKLHRIPILLGASAFSKNENCSSSFHKNNWFIPKYLIYRDFQSTKIVHFTFKSDDKIINKQNYNNLINKLKTFSPKNNSNIAIKESKITNLSQFEEYVNNIVTEIQNNSVSKVVSAIKNTYIVNELKPSIIMEKIQQIQNTYIYALRKNNALFFGASPENFLTYINNNLIIDSLASTAKLNSNYQSILQSDKFRTEQQIVSNFIHNILKKYSENINIDETQKYKIMSDLVHLRTIFTTQVKNFEDIFSIIEDLFPTPAVCGFPKEKAYNIILQNEPFNRELYSGINGYISFDSIELAVSIRCGLLEENNLNIYAGAGFIKESDIKEEYNEILNKINTITSILK